MNRTFSRLAVVAVLILAAAVGCERGPQQPNSRTNTIRLRTAAMLTGGGPSDAALWEVVPTPDAAGCRIAFFEEGPEGVRCLGRGVEIEKPEGTRHHAGFVILKDEPRGEEPPTVRLVTGSDGTTGNVYVSPITTRTWAFLKGASASMGSGATVCLKPDTAIEVFSTTYFPCEASPEDCEDRVYSGETDEQVDRTVYLALVREEPPMPYEWGESLPAAIEVLSRGDVQ